MKQQIEEMARTLCGEKEKTCQECGSCDLCEFWIESSTIYNAGYRKQSEWISVEERLPENNKDCLLLLDTKEIVIGWCRRDLHAFVEGGIVLVKDVTHWMPLPEPPSNIEVKDYPPYLDRPKKGGAE